MMAFASLRRFAMRPLVRPLVQQPSLLLNTFAMRGFASKKVSMMESSYKLKKDFCGVVFLAV
jgi:hypothetical protein